jgi:hypothetical protein
MKRGAYHPLDNLIKDDSLIMLEAMVPFVDYNFKKLLVIYIKYREFTLIMKGLNDKSLMEGCGFNKSAASTEDMMEMFLQTMSPDAAGNISNARKMMSMMQTMDNMNITPQESPTEPANSLYDSILNIIENENEGES